MSGPALDLSVFFPGDNVAIDAGTGDAESSGDVGGALAASAAGFGGGKLVGVQDGGPSADAALGSSSGGENRVGSPRAPPRLVG